ncbi:MAG TPA: CDP-diacylglycerol--serine O-phosphatidyltransferase [Rhizobiales bacterium]|nr:CDP-diacylglycerol--serine O-phosphatidyltransferase [Hyphomicrobiales bacterium]
MDPFDDSNDETESPRQARLKRFKTIPLKFLVPNAITLLALCLGVTAIRWAMDERFELAVAAIIAATVLDALDGRVARLLKGTSRFGAELDSLADFVNFGVTPALLIYMWSLNSLRNLGWVVALSLVIAMALRLARFNVALEDPEKPKWAVKFFTGVPAPAGAALAMLPMYLGFLGVISDAKAAAPYILVFVAFVAFLIISKIPTFSGKGLGQRVDRDLVLPILAGSVLFTVLLISYPWQMLTLCVFGYLAMLPISWRSYKRHQKADAENNSTA